MTDTCPDTNWAADRSLVGDYYWTVSHFGRDFSLGALDMRNDLIPYLLYLLTHGIAKVGLEFTY